ncbi:MAG: transglycosylase SLT domain-containing protein [Burkholderiales bacterium]
MYAKSIIEHVRGRLAAGAWTQQLSFVPVVMALGVAALPFTLEPNFASPEVSAAPSADASAVDMPGNLVKTAANASMRAGLPDERRYAVVAEYMARKYFVSRQVVLDLVKTAHVVGRKYNVDPMLLVAVIAIESSFNPISESVAGAKGLMQIIPQYHPEKFTEFGGEQAVFDPHTNIAVGAKIIREYLQAASGNLFTAMQTYAGALPDRDASYTHKVLNEKDRLDALMGLPKTDRGGRAESLSPAAAPAAPAPEPKERVQVTIPPPAAAIEPKQMSPQVAKPAVPTASVAAPATVAALRLP